MRLVLDANILLRTVISPDGPAAAVLGLISESQIHSLIVSGYLLDEVAEKLLEPRIQRRFAMSSSQVWRVTYDLARIGEWSEPERLKAIMTDPDDQPILETAVTGRADVLCTRDRDFHEPLVSEFCRARGIRVIDDLALLRELRKL
jgi:putative PIN family toxin of toxin-antitoxin system